MDEGGLGQFKSGIHPDRDVRGPTGQEPETQEKGPGALVTRTAATSNNP